MKTIMLFRNGRWVESDLKELPPHTHSHTNGKPDECDRCNAELYWDFDRVANKRKATT